jgi:hypothetical protein
MRRKQRRRTWSIDILIGRLLHAVSIGLILYQCALQASGYGFWYTWIVDSDNLDYA